MIGQSVHVEAHMALANASVCTRASNAITLDMATRGTLRVSSRRPHAENIVERDACNMHVLGQTVRWTRAIDRQ